MSELKEKKVASAKKTKTKEVEKKVKETKPKKTNDTKKEIVAKETKKDNVLLDKTKQKRLKTITKIISIIAKILRIFAMIIVPIMFVVMIMVPIIFKNVAINGNIITFNDSRLVMYNNSITANIGDKTFVLSDNIQNINHIISFLNNNSIDKLVLDFELMIGFSIIVIVINIFILQYVEKLFDNFYRNKTPFTEENSDYIYRIGRMMIVSLIVNFVFGIVLSIITNGVCTINIGTYGIIEILCIFVVYYIFHYAMNVQKQLDTSIYE